MTDKGYSVGVITGYPKEYNKSNKIKKNENVNNINIKRLSYLQLKRSNFLGRLINYFSFTTSVLLNFRKLKNYKVIMVFSNPPILPIIGVLAKKIFKSKFVFVSYDVYPEMAIKTDTLTENSIISKLMKFINKFVFKNVDKVITLSEEMSDVLSNNRRYIKPQNIVDIPNWDTSKDISTQNKTNEKFNHLVDKTVISYFGNLGIAQDEEVIFNTINTLKNESDYHFIFAGHGKKIELLREFVRENRIKNISIYDFLHGQDFEEALAVTNYSLVSLKDGLHGLAVPSKTYTLLRAGIPIFAVMNKNSDIVKSLLKYNAGIHIDKENYNTVIEKLKTTTKQENNQMKMNALKLYNEKYRRDLSTAKYIKVLNELVEE